MTLGFRKTGNEIAVLSIFVFVFCMIGAGLDVLLEKRIDPRPVGAGCFFLIMGLYAHRMKNKRGQTPETAAPQTR